jgi:hypothetical protein
MEGSNLISFKRGLEGERMKHIGNFGHYFSENF